jgi:hypothetical protein
MPGYRLKQSEGRKKEQAMWRNKTGRLIRVFAPFFLLLAGVLVINFKVEDLIFFQQTPIPGTPITIDQPLNGNNNTPPPSTGSLEPISTAIANATEMPTRSPESTANPTPTMFPREVITLTGPPEESRFSISTPLSFYWFSDSQLSDGESYKLFLIDDSIEKLVGTVSEPNLGSAFQVNFTPEISGVSPGEYFWKVKVTAQEGAKIMGESERRLITLFETED